MKKIHYYFLNFGILCAVATLAYFATLHFENRRPRIIVQPDAPIETIKESHSAPNFSFTDTNAKTHDLRDFEGKIIILNFWASWCPPCIKEFPHFIKAAQEFKDDIIFIGVSSDLTEEAMINFLNGMDISAPNIFITLDKDQSITKNLFQTYRLPETILIDANQIMRTKIIGADWDYEDLVKNIERLQQ